MPPKIFIDDFEKTENSDYLHGVLGRSLIIATRFDSMCTTLSQAMDIKLGAFFYTNNEEFKVFYQKIISKYRTLNTSIKTFILPEEIGEILHKARESRNEIAHSLTKGLEGCIDMKIDNMTQINEIKKLITNIIDGDIIISILTNDFNKDPTPTIQALEKYKNRVLDWVISP